MVKFHTVLRGNQAAAVVESPLDHGIGYIGALLRLYIDDERQRIAARSDSLETDVECRDTFRHRFFLSILSYLGKVAIREYGSFTCKKCVHAVFPRYKAFPACGRWRAERAG